MPGRALDGGDDDLEATARGSVAVDEGSGSGRSGRPRWGLFFGLAASIVVADQLTKAWIFANVDPIRPTEIVGDYVRLVISHNTGALFGLFRDQATLFALGSLAVIGLIVWYHGHSGRSLTLSVALGLLLGGAIGNLSDRLRHGFVLDFVDAGVGGLRWYTFNVADAAISGALLLLVLIALRPSLVGGSLDERGAIAVDPDGRAEPGGRADSPTGGGDG